jgi:uncharacterized membrane protein
MILTIHTLFGFLALIAGAWNLIAMKGTRRHRLVGWVYVGSMAGLLLTSFGIFELFGGFGPFHIMSLLAGGALALAIYFPLRRERYEHWIVHHYVWITYSYVGLVMATGSHLFDYGPAGWSFWSQAALYWGVPYVVGSALIFGRRDAILTRLRRRDATEGGV